MDSRDVRHNGDGSVSSEAVESGLNPYLDLARGDKPPEIIAFEMNTSPYATMPPNMSRRVSAPSRMDPDGSPTTRRSSLYVLVTIAVILAIAFARLLAAFVRF